MSLPADDLVVGRHAVAEALRVSPQQARELLLAADERGLTQIVDLARAAGVKVRQVERAKLDQLSQGARHQGVALRLAAVEYTALEEVLFLVRQAGDQALVVMADHIQDPHNLGALIRTAAAAGAQALVIAKDRACSLTPAVAKAAAGALTLLPVCRVTNLAQALERLKDAGLWALAAATRDADPPWSLDLNRPLVLLIGSEHKGLGPRLLKLCDLQTSLPLAPDVESLNASVAAGVLLFEVVRQRG
jgi:23S rRNA (guanosine2251-2'-O)-methyltransferase